MDEQSAGEVFEKRPPLRAENSAGHPMPFTHPIRKNMKRINTLFLALAITGCASNPITTTETREAAAQIKPGWTMAQVNALMGKPVDVVVSGEVQTNTYNTIKERNYAGCALAAATAPVTLGLSVVFCSSNPRLYRVTFRDGLVTSHGVVNR